MKITFDETLKRNKFLHAEIMNSVPPEALKAGEKDRCFDVKLIINGFECEPRYLNDIWSKIDSYIDKEADKIAHEKIQDALRQADILHDIIKDASQKIMSSFCLNPEDYE